MATVIEDPDFHSLSQTISIIVMFLIYAIIHISKRRLKERFVYLLPILMALNHFEHICGAEVELARVSEVGERMDLLEKWLVLIMNNFFLSSMLISPSLYFLLFGYGLPYAIANLYLMLKYGDFENKEFINYASAFPVYAVVAIGIFYIF